MAVQFKTWFFNSLAGYYKNNDTYKDNNGQGLLERYLECFGEELDQNFMGFLDNFTDLIDIEKVDEKYLYHLGFILGQPPTMGLPPSQYRKLLAYAISIYKIRGTLLCYKVVFAIMGYNVEVFEYPPQKKINYDSPTLYDGDDLPIYDTTCEWCSNYKLSITPIGNYTSEELEAWLVPDTLLDQLPTILNWIQPINARYSGLIKLLHYTDDQTDLNQITENFDHNIL